MTMQRRTHGSPDDSSPTVCVACNLPNGLILQLFDLEEVETVLPNGRVIKENQATQRPDLGKYALNGPVNRSALAATGREDKLPEDYRLIPGDAPDTGYALTFGIPRAFWEHWLHNNARSPIVTGKHVFAAGSEGDAIAEAKECREFKSGIQPLNQAGDYRVPNGRSVRKFSKSDNAAMADATVEE